ncbi:MAG: hypothetical protein ACO3A4_07585 [Silvanigrellaceae bacterium]
MNRQTLRTWTSVACAGFLTLFNVACGSKTREIPLRGAFLVEGQLAFIEAVQQKVKATPPTFSWVDRNGVRQPLNNVNFNATDGKFSFEFKRENLIRKMGYSLPEFTALMGSASPLERLSSLGYDQNETGFIRLEAYSEISTGNSGEISYYTQKVSGLPMSASFSTSRSLSMGNEPIQTAKVGVVKVIVKDNKGNPVEGAIVNVIPLNVFGGKTYDIKPYDFRLQSPFTPVANHTNAQGIAYAWPVPLGTDKLSKFQIAASHINYCTQTSAPVLHETTLQATTITLVPCDETQTKNLEVDWDVAFPPSLFVLSEPKGTLPAGTGYTNQEQVELLFTNKSALLRGITVNVHEGDSTEKPVVMSQDIYTFAEKLVIDLPGTFNNGTTASGRFLINLMAKLSDADIAAGRKPFSKSLTGNKGVFKLNAAVQSEFQVIGYNQFQNIISGNTDSTFVVKYTKCAPGYKIGVVISAEGKKDPAVNFVACDKAGNTFKLSEVFKGFTKQPGNNVIQFFRTDEFQNKSPDDASINQTNRRNIEIDYGTPDPTKATLGSMIAVVPKDTVEKLKPDLVTDATIEITNANLSQYALMFTVDAGTSTCELINPLAVENMDNPDSNSGRGVSHFYVGPTKSKSEMSNAAITCSSTSKAILSGDIVEFPTSPSEPATFKLTLFDKAGNFTTGTVSIPACTPTPANLDERVCWKNP